MKFLPLFLLGAALCLPATAQHHATGDTDDTGVLPVKTAMLRTVLEVAVISPGFAIVRTSIGDWIVSAEMGTQLASELGNGVSGTPTVVSWDSGSIHVSMTFVQQKFETDPNYSNRVSHEVANMQVLFPPNDQSGMIEPEETLWHRAA